MPEIRLPSLGAEMNEGTLLEWYVKPGDAVGYGQVVALLDTEKAEIEMESFVTGTVASLLIEPGTTVRVGTPIARLVEGGTAPVTHSAESPVESVPATAETPSKPAPPIPSAATNAATPASGAVPADSSTSRPAERARPRATPLARRLAAEQGVDLATLTGSGPHGAIVGEDVPPAGSAEPATRQRSRPRSERRREIIAAAMERSKREIPHYYLATTIEIEPALEWLAAHNEGREASDRILLPALLMKSVATAARRVPEMNGSWREGRFQPASLVHLGMVVSMRTGGVIVPTFRNVDQLSVPDLMSQLRDVVARARAGRLRSTELDEATLTLTSLGDRGADSIFGVIYPPQVAIAGFGGIHPTPVVENGLFGARSAIQASLAGDHRASDGQQGSRFLEAISRALSRPGEL